MLHSPRTFCLFGCRCRIYDFYYDWTCYSWIIFTYIYYVAYGIGSYELWYRFYCVFTTEMSLNRFIMECALSCCMSRQFLSYTISKVTTVLTIHSIHLIVTPVHWVLRWNCISYILIKCSRTCCGPQIFRLEFIYLFQNQNNFHSFWFECMRGGEFFFSVFLLLTLWSDFVLTNALFHHFFHNLCVCVQVSLLLEFLSCMESAMENPFHI